MNSQINFTPDERMNYLNKRISSLEERLQHNGVPNQSLFIKLEISRAKTIPHVPSRMENGITNQYCQTL